MLLQKAQVDLRLRLPKCVIICVPKGLLQCTEGAKKAIKRQLSHLFLPQLENPKSLLNEKDPTQIIKESVNIVIIKFLSLPREITDIVPLLCRMQPGV